MFKKFILSLVLVFLFKNAQAFQIIEGKVLLVEATYLPNSVTFQLSNGNSNCPVATWLKWTNADQSNNKAVFSMLLATLISGKTIRLYLNEADTTCTGVFIHVF